MNFFFVQSRTVVTENNGFSVRCFNFNECVILGKICIGCDSCTDSIGTVLKQFTNKNIW